MNKYEQRHKILSMLYTQFIKYHNKKGLPLGVDFKEITNELKCTGNDLHIITASLFDNDEVGLYSTLGVEGIYLKPKGISAFSDKKHLKEPIKLRNDSIYDVVKWMLPIALIIVSITTTLINIQLNRDREKTQQQIKQITLELNNLRHLKTPLPDIKVYLDSTYLKAK